jgi:hypothetical protein
MFNLKLKRSSFIEGLFEVSLRMRMKIEFELKSIVYGKKNKFILTEFLPTCIVTRGGTNIGASRRPGALLVH